MIQQTCSKFSDGTVVLVLCWGDGRTDGSSSLCFVSRRPSSTAIAERGRHHKHEAEKLGRGEAAEKTLRNLHYLAAATFFIENALRNPALDKVTQDFMVHVLRSLASDDAVIVDLGLVPDSAARTIFAAHSSPKSFAGPIVQEATGCLVQHAALLTAAGSS
jgi:hypothetical protein